MAKLNNSRDSVSYRDSRNFRSIKSEIWIALVVALLISVTFYFILSTIIFTFMESYFGSEEYCKKHDRELMQRFSDFIDENFIHSDQWYPIRSWAEDNDIYKMSIYKNRILVFHYDSTNPKESYNRDVHNAYKMDSKATNIEMETDEMATQAYELRFGDGICDVIVTRSYADKYYLLAQLLSLFLPVLLFNIIMMQIVKRKFRYILELSESIKDMGQGNFSTPVRLRGNDDLTSMAMDLDFLRLSFVQKLKENTRIQEERYDVITAMSHDMRTPMTPLLVYLQMLADNNYSNEEQHDQYVNKSLEKALQLKNLSDNMFSYLMLDKDANVELVSISMKEAFYDQLSGMFDFLKAEGFTVDADIAIENVKISMNMEYLYRIFDNLVSNIQKYANPESYLKIKLYCEHGKVILHLRNKINALADYSNSTGFGIKNIKKMMENINAEFIEAKKPDRYDTILIFDIIKSDEEGVSADREY